MAGYQFPEIRKFEGLYLQANSFEVPDGAMEEAQNVVIRSDNIISKTKGFYTIWTPKMGDPVIDLRSLVAFQDFLIGFFFDGIAYFDFSPVTANDEQGEITEITGEPFIGAQPTRSLIQNQVLYFTGANGMFKLENVIGGRLMQMGLPHGLDLNFKMNDTAQGPLPADSQTAFRVIFSRKDSHGNLYLSAPSDILTVGVQAGGVGVAYTSAGGPPWIVSVTTASPHGLTTGQEVTVSGATSSNANGTFAVTVLSPTVFQYSESAGDPTTGTLSYTFFRSPTLEISIPAELNFAGSSYFVQIYRTSSSIGVAVTPTPDFKLIAEIPLTALNLADRVIFFTDDVDPLLMGAELYTNPNSREGELQANYPPPLGKDLCLYKGYVITANVRTKPQLFLQLIDPVAALGQTISFQYQSTTENYIGTTSSLEAGNRNLAAQSVSGVGTVTITYVGHGFSNGYTVLISNVTGTVPEGIYTISGVTPNTFDITSVGNTATALDFEGLTDGTDAIFYVDFTSPSLGVQIENTAKNLVKAVNRTSNLIYGNYVSTFDENPGKMRFDAMPWGTQSSDLAVAQSNENQQIFLEPVNETLGTGGFLSETSRFVNGLYVSKFGEPEAFPVINFFAVGARDKEILRIFALRDSVVIVKEDGIFRMTGDVVDNFAITVLDSTVFGLITALNGYTAINNTVIGITNQGVVEITENAVQIVSRRIDDLIQPIVGEDIFPTYLFGYETERLVFMSTISNVEGQDNLTYLYNVVNKTWTTLDVSFSHMALGPDDKMYCLSGEFSSLFTQRKNNNLIDYSNEYQLGTAQSFVGNPLQATLTLTGVGNFFNLEIGDAVFFNGNLSKIASITPSGPDYILSFQTSTNIPSSGTNNVVVYQGYDSIVKMAPFHAGQVGRSKHFAQLQVHLRQNQISELMIQFAGEYFGGSEEIDWIVTRIQNSALGWAQMPWGLFPWGLETGIRIAAGTLPSPILRTWVPRFAARNTFIQPILLHRQAGELLLIQALSWAVRGYGERTTK